MPTCEELRAEIRRKGGKPRNLKKEGLINLLAEINEKGIPPIVNIPITNSTSRRKEKINHGKKMNDDGSCPIEGCNWICKSRKMSTFQMHITMKHGVELGIRQENTYRCEECNKNFMSRSILNNHLKNIHNKST